MPEMYDHILILLVYGEDGCVISISQSRFANQKAADAAGKTVQKGTLSQGNVRYYVVPAM
jgi:hypothetical protein